MSTKSSSDTLKVTGFIVLSLVAVVICGASLYLGGAPFKSPFVSDWFDWVRAEPTWPGVFVVGFIVLLIGIIGALFRMVAGVGAAVRAPRQSRVRHDPFEEPALSVPAANTRATQTAQPQAFDVQSLVASGLTVNASAPEPVAPVAVSAFAEPPTIDIQSLEPAIFSDNASDSFLSRDAVQATQTPFDPAAALSETHGLQVMPSASVPPEPVSPQPMAQVIPIRPDIQVVPELVMSEPVTPESGAPAAHDPLEAALLADTSPVAARPVPPSDITAVISSAMRFIETPGATDAPVVESLPEPQGAAAAPIDAPAAELSGFHAVAAAMEPTDDQAIIRQAVQMALSVWPDATRAIAADELNVRVSYLYFDKNPQSNRAFHQIANGDLSAAALTLQSQAETLSSSGAKSEAAEIWRVIGALNMGRDDAKALNAYEKVSELDASDANIHLYLARRYLMAGETVKLRPVLDRALAVIGDPATRLELLGPYADQLMKAGDAKAAGDAFEELSRLHETRAYLKPDDISSRSQQGISLARGAQAREAHGAYDQAGTMYKKAYRVFADLSAQLPEHAGLRAMAENASKDAQRFNLA